MPNNIFLSTGLKRTLASILAAAVPVIQNIPVLAPYAQTVTLLAALFGVVGVGHAAFARTLSDTSKEK